jgi:hypothetical protein
MTHAIPGPVTMAATRSVWSRSKHSLMDSQPAWQASTACYEMPAIQDPVATQLDNKLTPASAAVFLSASHLHSCAYVTHGHLHTPQLIIHTQSGGHDSHDQRVLCTQHTSSRASAAAAAAKGHQHEAQHGMTWHETNCMDGGCQCRHASGPSSMAEPEVPLQRCIWTAPQHIQAYTTMTSRRGYQCF